MKSLTTRIVLHFYLGKECVLPVAHPTSVTIPSTHSLCTSPMANFAERRFINLTARKVDLLLL